jgi:hypothetical protein
MPGFVLRVLGQLPAAVHVRGEGWVAQPSQLFAPPAGVVVEPPPLVNNLNTRLRPLPRRGWSGMLTIRNRLYPAPSPVA